MSIIAHFIVAELSENRSTIMKHIIPGIELRKTVMFKFDWPLLMQCFG